MQTNKKRYERFNFKKVFVSLLILLTFTISAFPVITDNAKGEYIDDSSTLGSYIAWITLYDQDGAVIVNWTSLNDDTIPNVNSEDRRIGYWSMGIYVNESDGGYSSNPANAISIYLQFKNITDDLSWYPNPSNYKSYLSSYTDYGTYTIVNYKTPDWQTQMTYDWWRLDTALNVNASLYFNYGSTGVVQETNTSSVLSSDVVFLNVYNSYDAVYSSVNQGHVYCRDMGSDYQIWRHYFWFENPDANLDVVFDFTSMVGSYNSIYAMVYDDPVNNDDWSADYWSLENWSETSAVFNPDGTAQPDSASINITSDTLYWTIPASSTYGDYIFIMLISSADWQQLPPMDSTSNFGGSSNTVYGVTVPNNFILAYSFEQQIINHVPYSMDVNNVIWLLIALLPALILGYFIGRPGVIAGLAIMSLILGYSQANYFWVMATTLGVCAIMLYKGGVR